MDGPLAGWHALCAACEARAAVLEGLLTKAEAKAFLAALKKTLPPKWKKKVSKGWLKKACKALGWLSLDGSGP